MKILFVLLVLVLTHPCLADSLYINANLYTVNPEQPRAEALYVVDGKVAYVGSEQEARIQASDDVTVIDLHGQTVIPGFIEGHGHLMSMGYAQLNLDLMDVANYEALVEKVAVAVDSAEKRIRIMSKKEYQRSLNILLMTLSSYHFCNCSFQIILLILSS